jgi:integrase
MGLIIRELGKRSADGIKPLEIERWLASHAEWSAATKNRYKTVLSKAFQLALKNDEIARNPARLVERQNEGDGRIRYLRPDEESRLTTAIQNRCAGHLPAFIFAIHTGLRKSEQFGLTWLRLISTGKSLLPPIQRMIGHGKLR